MMLKIKDSAFSRKFLEDIPAGSCFIVLSSSLIVRKVDDKYYDLSISTLGNNELSTLPKEKRKELLNDFKKSISCTLNGETKEGVTRLG